MQLNTYLMLIPMVSLLCYCILLAIILGSRKNKLARYYTYYIMTMIVWSFGAFMMRTSLGPSMTFWNRILCIGLILMPVVFYHFTLILTDTSNQASKLYFGYASAVLFLIGNFTGLITKEVYMKNGEFTYVLGDLAEIMAVWSIIYLILAFANIFHKVKSNKIPYFRVKFVIFGLILVIVGGLLNLSPDLGKYPLDIALNTLNAIFIAYSIYKYRFLEIKLVVKKGIAYSVYTLMLSGVYIIAIIVVQQFINTILEINSRTATLVMAVMLAAVFQPIRNFLQHWIDRVFYREKENHQTLLKDFSKNINNVLNLDELTDLLLDAVERGIRPKNISLVLSRGREEYHLVRTTTGGCEEESIKYSSNHPIIQWFNQGKTILTIGEIERLHSFTSLWSSEKKQLQRLDTEFIVPMKIREQLLGFLILSEKKGGETYLEEEINLLSTLINNAAVVMENAKMYEEAKHKSITDGLTNLYNHRYFHEVLSSYIHNSQCECFSVAMIDVDMFKLYNDLYGHSTGDKALFKIAEAIRQATRKEDIVARYGGEEFAVIFPGLQGSDSFKAIEKIRRAVESSFYSSSNISEFLTVSVGAASYPRDGKTVGEILDYADKAMYSAKDRGRNQCVLYSDRNEVAAGLDGNQEVENMQESINSAYFSAIYALAATIDAKDHYTYGHSESVSRYAVGLAKAAGFSEDIVQNIKNAGLLHDIGKIGIPESILTKKESLTNQEFDIMKKHVDNSITIIKHVPGLVKLIPAIMSHHERYDGKGYPRGLRGENIPVEGRCLCIVDAFDAMTTDRPYRKALSVEEALAELRRCKGSQFDPCLTEVFIKMFEDGEIEVA